MLNTENEFKYDICASTHDYCFKKFLIKLCRDDENNNSIITDKNGLIKVAVYFNHTSVDIPHLQYYQDIQHIEYIKEFIRWCNKHINYKGKCMTDNRFITNCSITEADPLIGISMNHRIEFYMNPVLIEKVFDTYIGFVEKNCNINKDNLKQINVYTIYDDQNNLKELIHSLNKNKEVE